MNNKLINISADAHYIQGYVSVAYPEDEQLNKWANHLLHSVELAMEDTLNENNNN